MANILIGGTDTAGDSALPTINSTDPINDLIPIYQQSSNSTNAISRNNYLGITGSPVGTSDSQSLSNKTIGNANTITVKDGSSFTLQNAADTTKQARFSLSGITTGNTRTYTVPDYNATFASLAGIETLTNKTLTSPTINTAVISNPTLTVDSIAGFSSGTVVSVANLSISNGVLNTNNSVVTTNITDGNVTPAKLQSGTGGSWSWSTWSPSYANLTVGNGTVTSKYIQIGKTVFFIYKLALGSTSAVGTSPTISFPVTSVSTYGTNDMIGTGFANTGTANAPLWAQWVSTTTFQPTVFAATGTYVATQTLLTASIPGTWGTGNLLTISGFYEAA